MKKLTLLFAFMLVAMVTFASESYKINNNQVDALFNNASEVSLTNLTQTSDMNALATSTVNATYSDATTKVLIAWVVDWFLGGFGVHRYVLGTKPSMWAIYTFTVCGIFGIVPTVDWFVLLIDGLILQHGEKYMNNEKFFMWA